MSENDFSVKIFEKCNGVMLQYSFYRTFFCNLLCNLILAVGSECPIGWTFNPDTSECYTFSARLFTFDESVQYCNSIGGKSVSISSYSERDALVGKSSLELIRIVYSFQPSPKQTFYNLGLVQKGTLQPTNSTISMEPISIL